MSVNSGSGRKGLFFSLGLSLASLAVILWFTVDEKTLDSLLGLKTGYLALAALMVLLLWLAEGLRIRSIARALGYEGPLKLTDAIRIFLGTYFFAGITPLAIGEWPAQVWFLCRLGLSAGESAAVSLVRTFLTKCLLVVLAAFLFVAGRPFGGGDGLIYRLFHYAFPVLAASTAAYLLMLWQAGLAQKVLERLLRLSLFSTLYQRNPRLRLFVARLLAEAVQFQETAGRFNRQNGLLFVLPLLYTVMFWGVFYSIAPVLLLGLGIVPDFWTVVLRQVVIMLVIAYVPLPGGSGVAEFGLASLFAAFVPAHVLGVFIVAWRFFTYYMTLIFGGVLAFSIKC